MVDGYLLEGVADGTVEGTTMTDKIKKLKKKVHEERLTNLERELKRYEEAPKNFRICPTCHEPCAHGWCGKCERILP